MRPGPRDHLITQRVAKALASVDPSLIDRVALDAAEGPARFARHLATVIERALRDIADDAEAQAALVNELVAARASSEDRGAELVALPPEVWQGVKHRPERLGDAPHAVPAPTVPLSTSDLLANAEGQPNIGICRALVVDDVHAAAGEPAELAGNVRARMVGRHVRGVQDRSTASMPSSPRSTSQPGRPGPGGMRHRALHVRTPKAGVRRDGLVRVRRIVRRNARPTASAC
jgi:hypothetical protein